MNQNDSGRIISLRALFVTLFSAWRRILLVGLIFALLAGGYHLYKTWPVSDSAAEDKTTRTEQDSKGLNQNSIEELISKNLSEKSTYLDNSILAKINPAAEGRAEVNIFVSTEELENQETDETGTDGQIDMVSGEATSGSDSTDAPNVISSAQNGAQVLADRILNAYLSYAMHSVDFSELAKKMDTEPVYLQELVSVDDIQNDIVGAKIIVRYTDPDGAKEILDTIISQLTAQKDSIANTNGSHTISFENETSATVVDDDLFPWLNNKIQDLNNLMNNQDTFSTAASSRSASGLNQTAQVSKASVLKGSVKYAVVGFAGGIVLYLLLGMLILILMKKVLSGRELNQQYKLQKLSIMPSVCAKKRRGLDKVIASARDADRSADQTEECYRIAAANIRYLAPENAKILLVGDLSSEQMQDVLTHLKSDFASEKDGNAIHFLDNGNRLDDPKSLHLLNEADAVILIARRGVSRYSHIDEIIRTVDAYRKEILGSIVF
ncbi:MAG: hypothetical protein ACI4ET_05300 [Bilifractor sp.]